MLRDLRGALEDFRHALRGSDPPAEAVVSSSPPATVAAEPAAVPTPAGESAADSPLEEGPTAGASVEIGRIAVAGWRPRWALWLGGAVALLVAGLLVARWAPWQVREPADPSVVATFQGGVVTRDELRRELEALPATEQSRYRTTVGLRALAADVALEQVIQGWAQERQVDQQDRVKDALKHATEQVQIAEVSQQLREGRIPVGEGEIQDYYDRNRERWGGRPLVEVREQIRQLVIQGKEQEFVDNYLKDLRERASLQVDESLLDVPEPSDAELADYYQANRDRFRVAEQASIAQVQVSVSLAGGDEKARAKAESARARAAGGEDFAQVAQELSDGPEKVRGGELAGPVARGSRGEAFDQAVFVLPLGGISPVFREGDSYYVIKLLDRAPERVRPYDEVRADLAGTLRQEREQQVYQERTGRTLFSIHGRRTTLGEFLQEINELPAENRAQYADAAAKRKILQTLIDRLLLVEDATEQAVDSGRSKDLEHARTDLLAQFLHEDEVDAKARVTDEEVRTAYERNREHYAEPPRVKVRYIRVGRGTTADADQKARAKIEEAMGKVQPSGLLGGGPSADFAEVARQYSEDPDAAARGGDLERWITESGDSLTELMEHPLHQELFPLKVGEVSRVLPIGDSYYLFQIREKQETRQRSFEEAQDLVRQDLEAHKHEQLNQQMQRQLLDRIQLQVYDRRLDGFAGELGAASAGTSGARATR